MKNVPLLDVAIFGIAGILLWIGGIRRGWPVMQDTGGVLVGLAVAALLVGFSPLGYIRNSRARRKR